MIEIGTIKTVRVRDNRPGTKIHYKRDATGAIETKSVSAEVWRVTRDALGGQFGSDKRRKLAVGLVGVDQLVLCPVGTRQELRLNLKDVYAFAIRTRSLNKQLETARARKLKLQAARARRNIAAADHRIKLAARAANRA